jgi:hypothetical protein
MMTLSRRQYMKLSFATIGLLAASMMDPVSMVSALLEEPATFRLPDRRMEALTYADGVISYQAVIYKPTSWVGKVGEVTSLVSSIFKPGDPFKDSDFALALNGRRLKVRDYPELAQMVREGKL